MRGTLADRPRAPDSEATYLLSGATYLLSGATYSRSAAAYLLSGATYSLSGAAYSLSGAERRLRRWAALCARGVPRARGAAARRCA